MPTGLLLAERGITIYTHTHTHTHITSSSTSGRVYMSARGRLCSRRTSVELWNPYGVDRWGGARRTWDIVKQRGSSQQLGHLSAAWGPGAWLRQTLRWVLRREATRMCVWTFAKFLVAAPKQDSDRGGGGGGGGGECVSARRHSGAGVSACVCVCVFVCVCVCVCEC